MTPPMIHTPKVTLNCLHKIIYMNNGLFISSFIFLILSDLSILENLPEKCMDIDDNR